VVELGKPLLHRLYLEIAFAHVLEVLRRPEEEVDDRAEERREEPDHCGERDEPWLLDAATRVLERPERGREPEHDEDDDPEVPGERPVRVGKENGDVHSSSLPTR
jgi:hypothetical protein